MESACPNVVVLSLHGVVPAIPEFCSFDGSRTCLLRLYDFERLVRYCASRYKFLKVSELDDFITTGSSEQAIVLTFDDALASVVDYAAPVLERYNASATLFITTDWTEQQQIPTVFQLERDLWERTPCTLRIEAGTDAFERKISSRKDLPRLLEALWHFLFSSNTPPLSLKPSQITFDNIRWIPTSVREPREFWQPASWTELQQLVESGRFDIGSHGITHTPWPALTQTELENELRQSRRILEDVFQQSVTVCAYPHGQLNSAVAKQTAAVYTWAFANSRVPLVAASPRSAVPRVHVPSERPVLPSQIISWPLVASISRRIASILRVD